ncbi:response regulator [Polyangium sorediatum]|uniref:histidine kinase n=1 Tax=Polyangium sorediatum TaxID=889274 RepID=A0ABT6NS88_9BACT|nr:response regulator [Polyangium sorediatum]MDI1431178.1 response regulator [Polyangium sorediatum]
MSRTAPDAVSYTILIVDDLPASLAMAIAHLEERGYLVAIAQDGEDALDLAERLSPDLILLDVLMPGMDGLATCRRLKASEKTRGIPVIFMTALGETSHKVAGFEAGGVDYVVKPLEITEVIARIETHVALHAMRAQLEAQNAELRREVATREDLTAELRRAHDKLEKRVQERTVELAAANDVLKQEIADRKRVEEERETLLLSEQAARAKAEAADRLKDEFLSTLSHELRTPLTAILGWAQMLLRADPLDAAKVQRGLEVIERNGMAELRLVEALLDVSAILRGKVDLKLGPVQIAQLIQAVVDSAIPSAEAKCICLSQSLGAATHTVWGDHGRLEQVVRNLLSNAIKFTPPGGCVAVSLREVGAMARLRISDTGEGICANVLPYVFDPFRQADSSSTRRHGGLGLGLAIVRDLVRMHGGTVHGESAGEGHGAEFTVDLPLMLGGEETAGLPKAGAEERGRGPFPSLLAGLRVLVVDDESDMRELMKCILGEAGAEVRVATVAREGFEIFERWRPDVLVSDIGLPGEDGYALIRKIRELPVDQGGRTPAAALTAYADQHTRERTLSAGYQVHIAKPVHPTSFKEMVARLGQPRRV